MFKIDGLDKLQKELEQAERAFNELDGDLGQVSFDPDDPASINSAIISMERIIDDRVGRYSNNEIVVPMIQAAKEKIREAIIQKASLARLKSDNE